MWKEHCSMCSVTSPWAKIAFKGSALGTNRDRVQYHTIEYRLIDVMVVGSLNFFGQGSKSSSFYRASVVLAKLQVWALAGAFAVVHFYQIFTAYPLSLFRSPFLLPLICRIQKRCWEKFKMWHVLSLTLHKVSGENLAIAFFWHHSQKNGFVFKIQLSSH